MSPILEAAVKTLIQEVPNIIGLYVFGSVGTDFEKADSDLDLAILCDSIIPAKDLSVFAFQIVSTGKRIYCGDKNKCDEFEMLAYSSYLRFNEERKESFEAIKKRGSIFNG